MRHLYKLQHIFILLCHLQEKWKETYKRNNSVFRPYMKCSAVRNQTSNLTWQLLTSWAAYFSCQSGATYACWHAKHNPHLSILRRDQALFRCPWTYSDTNVTAIQRIHIKWTNATLVCSWQSYMYLYLYKCKLCFVLYGFVLFPNYTVPTIGWQADEKW